VIGGGDLAGLGGGDDGTPEHGVAEAGADAVFGGVSRVREREALGRLRKEKRWEDWRRRSRSHALYLVHRI
jgi:hypothetical protein